MRKKTKALENLSHPNHNLNPTTKMTDLKIRSLALETSLYGEDEGKMKCNVTLQSDTSTHSFKLHDNDVEIILNRIKSTIFGAFEAQVNELLRGDTVQEK